MNNAQTLKQVKAEFEAHRNKATITQPMAKGLKHMPEYTEQIADDLFIARIYNSDHFNHSLHSEVLGSTKREANENAERMVKHNNMHRELVEALKEFIDTSPCKNGCKKNDMTCLTNRSKALLKEAEEQK